MDTQGIPAAHITILAKRQDKKNPDYYHWQSWSMTQKSKWKYLLHRQDLNHDPLEPKARMLPKSYADLYLVSSRYLFHWLAIIKEESIYVSTFCTERIGPNKQLAV